MVPILAAAQPHPCYPPPALPFPQSNLARGWLKHISLSYRELHSGGGWVPVATLPMNPNFISQQSVPMKKPLPAFSPETHPPRFICIPDALEAMACPLPSPMNFAIAASAAFIRVCRDRSSSRNAHPLAWHSLMCLLLPCPAAVPSAHTA